MDLRLILCELGSSTKIEDVIQVLGEFPSLSEGVIRNQLQKLPWSLPQIEEEKGKKLEQRLVFMGCRLEREGATPDLWPSEGLAEEELVEERPLRQAETVAEEEVFLSSHSHQSGYLKKGTKKWVTTGAGFVVLILFPLILWLLRTEPDTSTPSATSMSEGVAGSNRSVENPKSRANKKAAQSLHNPSSGSSKKSAKQDLRSNLRRIGELKENVKKSPENKENWEEWIALLEGYGKWEAARKVRQQHYKVNTEVREQAESILLRYGGIENSLQLSPTQFKVGLNVPEKGEGHLLQRGYLLYREIRKLHGDKKISVSLESPKKKIRFNIPARNKPLGTADFKKHLIVE